ncbi:peptide/nickel transport system permease protein [Planctomicrobium piriforme]|uniref:Peptide/nickel transport system permease protein n=2 Tax=Planctomicrobium piriforme TaxID=1576369 RepID=A0A1I3GW31_9PLAN|nr:peptide/nickel transport system permease protein [Planctomicrobium piriforme]
MLALVFVSFLALVALFSPAIVGTKPLVCRYKGQLYFPCLGYYSPRWEAAFSGAPFFKRYPKPLKENDPGSWAIWPLKYNDPSRAVTDDEVPGRPANPQSSGPTWLNWFGTDSRGFDVFAQMVHGTRTALLVGFVSMGIAAAIGLTFGSIAGYYGGWTDIVLSRVIEVVMCIPTLILILALIAVIEKPTTMHMMAVIGMTSWTGIARLVRGEFLKLKQMEYVAAAKVLGVSSGRIIFRYLLPNSLAPVLVPITFGVAAAILIETALSYIGFGAPPPNPSWGQLLRSGQSNYQNWWLILFPGLGIFLTVLAYNLIGEGLQEATDPRLRDGGR